MKFATRLIPTVAAKKVSAASSVRPRLSTRATICGRIGQTLSEQHHRACGDEQRDERKRTPSKPAAPEIAPCASAPRFSREREKSPKLITTAAK